MLFLSLLWSLVEVSSQQTSPYVSFMDQTLANNSYVDLSLVGDDFYGSDSVRCHTNLSTCCWRAGASQPSRFNGRFFSLYIYIFIYFGRWTPPYRNVLRDSKYAHKCEISKKQHKTPRVFEARLFVMDAAQHSSHIVLCAAKNFPRKLVNGN